MVVGWFRFNCIFSTNRLYHRRRRIDVVDLRAQADASMPASNNNVNTIYSNF